MHATYTKLPSSFDPAIYLHSEPVIPQDPSFSEDIAALHAVKDEVRAQKNKLGIVIQHRAYKVTDTFRADDDDLFSTPTRYLGRISARLADLEELDGGLAPAVSSSPSFPGSAVRMAIITSPQPARKRRKLDDDDGARTTPEATSKNISQKTGFAESDSDSDSDSIFNLNPPRDFDSPGHVQEYIHKSSHKLAKQSEIEAQLVCEDESMLPDHNRSYATASFLAADTGAAAIESDLQYSPQDQPPYSPCQPLNSTTAQLFNGKQIFFRQRTITQTASYERTVASRSVTTQGRATRAYYGIDIHNLLQQIQVEDEEKRAKDKMQQAAHVTPSVESGAVLSGPKKKAVSCLWTEKYRARKFTDLVGDERTHRSVLHWLKRWDPIVFPGSGRKYKKSSAVAPEDTPKHCKILLLTGPSGLGKTTLAHVCARQAGYEVQEINASDERSRDVVKGRIRDMVATENVKGSSQALQNGKMTRKAGRPVCVIVDEVDGVVGGSGDGGEGGFIKALIDLINLDHKNLTSAPSEGLPHGKKRKGDKFRLLRPIILICNNVYHPSLRPLRQGSIAEVVHCHKPSLGMVISRLESIFNKENVACDADGVRRLCEAAWGVGSKKESLASGTIEGDVRSILIVAEWVASRYRNSCLVDPDARVSKLWLDQHVLSELSYGGGAARSLGRGGAREVVDRVFQEAAGFPKAVDAPLGKSHHGSTTGVARNAKQCAIDRLRDMIDASAEHEKIITDCFSLYLDKPIQDDNYLGKPQAAYEWLHFHDTISSQVFSSHDWELAPYMSCSILAFHDLFASSLARHARAQADTNSHSIDNKQPISSYSGLSAPYAVSEALKANNAAVSSLQTGLSPALGRMYHSKHSIATELVPYTLCLLSPDVKPVIVNLSSGTGARVTPTASVRRAEEKERVSRAVDCMAATGVRFEKSRIEESQEPSHSDVPAAATAGAFIYRMEPGLDSLALFPSLRVVKHDTVRYAVRQVLQAEWQRRAKRPDKSGAAALALAPGMRPYASAYSHAHAAQASGKSAGKRDFFGRLVVEPQARTGETGEEKQKIGGSTSVETAGRVWISFHEGYSNAVRRPITLQELMRGL